MLEETCGAWCVHDGGKSLTAFAGSKGWPAILPLLPSPNVAVLQAIVQDMRNVPNARSYERSRTLTPSNGT
jgi:hypothetical protein